MKTKVLLFVDYLVNGGVEKVVVNIALGLNKEQFEVCVYCLDPTNECYIDMLTKHGVEVVSEYQERSQNMYGNQRTKIFRCLKKYLKRHRDISVVHNHSYNHSAEVLLAAKLNNIRVICEHSHAAYSDYWNPNLFSLKSKIIVRLNRFFTERIPDYKIGCSKAACERAFTKTKNQYYIPNGIELKRFDSEMLPNKYEIRSSYGFDMNALIMTFIGRFSPQKNPFFMLDVFATLRKKRADIQFVVVGYGELEVEIKNKVKELNLTDAVLFLPPNSDVPTVLKGSDYFISPSIFEGLGIVFIEAQLMGIPAFASDQVPKEADLGLCEFIPLELGVEGYSDYILKYINKRENKSIDPEKSSLFDIDNVISAYENIYLDNRSEVVKWRVK